MTREREREYNWDVTLAPWGKEHQGRVWVDTRELRGVWTRKDGSEGGDLWFGHAVDGVWLTDYDGEWLLPAAVVLEIERAGFKVEEGYCDGE